MLRDEEGDELLTFGFVRKAFKSPMFRNVQEMPHYLIQLIGKWIHNEYLHLIGHAHSQEDEDEDNHLRINIDDILKLLI